MFRITTQKKIQIASPNQGWSLVSGANHFEGDIPDAVGIAYAKLQKDEAATVEVLDGTGGATPWVYAKPASPDRHEH